MTQDFNYEEGIIKIAKTNAGHYRTGGLVQKIIKECCKSMCLAWKMEDFILQEKEKASSVTRNGNYS